MTKSAIEWTEHSWNPFAGCSVLTPGCTNCYAMKMAARLDAMGQPLYKGLTMPSKAGPVWRGTIRRASDDVLLAPLRRKKPTTYFVNSMSDLFYETFPDEWIDQVFAVMALSPQHTFQVLTKRAARMRDYFEIGTSPHGTSKRLMKIEDAMAPIEAGKFDSQIAVSGWPLPNVWLGVSTERQQEADERIPLLLQTPAAVRFISAEPLLGPVDLTRWVDPISLHCIEGHTAHHVLASEVSYIQTKDENIVCPICPSCGGDAVAGNDTRLSWVIVGGESGPKARPMHPAWARDLRDQCEAAGVAFFFKQWGGIRPKSAGRHLDGVLHDAMPQEESRSAKSLEIARAILGEPNHG